MERYKSKPPLKVFGRFSKRVYKEIIIILIIEIQKTDRVFFKIIHKVFNCLPKRPSSIKVSITQGVNKAEKKGRS